MDAAIYTLNIVRSDDVAPLVTRLRERLSEAPEISIDHRPAALRFTCKTWRPTLIDRVNAALDAEVGPEERERRFRPFG